MRTSSDNPATLFRRVASGVYDIFILFALLLFATAIGLLLNHGHSFGKNNLLFTLYLITVIGFFYCWFWTHGGQTLGMQAWKIKVVDQNLEPINWTVAIKRFIFAVPSVSIFGLGYLASFLNKNKLSVHDWASQTRVVTTTPSSSPRLLAN